MSHKGGMIFVVLPAGTELTGVILEPEPSFTLQQPALAEVSPMNVLASLFIVSELTSKDGRATELPADIHTIYVSGQPSDFASGETAAEAWANFHASQEKK